MAQTKKVSSRPTKTAQEIKEWYEKNYKNIQNFEKVQEALKEELVNMVRKKRDSGKDSFELTPEKANKLHDDRAYTACMASYALMCERRKAITNKKRTNNFDITKMVGVSKRPKKWGFYN